MLNESSLQNIENSDYRLKVFKEYASLDKPNWKRVGYKYEEPAEYKKFNNATTKNENQNGLVVKEINDSLEELERLKNDNEYGLGEFFKLQNFAFYNEGKYVKVSERKEIKNPVYISYTTNKENNFLVDYNVIEVEDFAKVTVIITYNSEDDIAAYHNGIIRVAAGKNSEVKIIKIQNLNTNSSNFESSKIETKGQGKVNYYSIELGAKINGISHKTYLLEDAAEAYIWPGYLADGSRKLDLEYSLVFKGRKSIGEIHGRGAVKDTATKVFRGNMYFKRGASKSEGREGEFAILLDKDVKVHAIPTLFCDEDDVIGEHYASIGKVDESKLFYLMSRGLSEGRAKKLIVESSFKPILDNIDDELIREHLLDELERRI
ncbi:MAG: Fe-S cluster assembly protein SufD [Leptotrichiaceae bacterium]|nr:Fe-S cluster assembly protein SufD [Leptotrichiaceae bacterium]MBP6280509.1 Fe-S cluster assembly protein SufD [Leptotrichiaceae bacterium]MBP7100070.1 Fe-S cluster assembly protein SufD [Leptotrichiaceae bacterium]MBP7725219.1 Fe-S cluster assembly protein SufD [Leptotrichiaceae bacterium]MBP9629876.1 Fe-S cluster assembly protein SufD [Leptotrichiaceae bacterium]